MQEEPAAVREPVAVSSSGDRKPCPSCGEMILKPAVKCRFCKTWLDKSRKPRNLNVLDRQFSNAPLILLLFFPFLCTPFLAFPLWFGLLGIVGCSDSRSRGRAILVTLLSFLVAVTMGGLLAAAQLSGWKPTTKP
jgi:hypothetical protein